MKVPAADEMPLVVLILGVLLVLYMLSSALLKKYRLPEVMAGIAIGMAAREISEYFPFEHGWRILEFMGTLGIVTLLFRAGLEANITSLRQQFKGAVFLWFCNVSVSAMAGFAAARWWLDYDLVTSLAIAVALSATSVGIPIEIWRNSGKLRSNNGQRMLEVAELDDISAVLLLALLLALIPTLSGADSTDIWTILSATLGLFAVKLFGFFALCWCFAKYLEKRVTDFFRQSHPVVVVAGIGFILSAVAGMLGFSVAIGAFFAGLCFSRDSHSAKSDGQFELLYELFTPFFFIYLGFQVPLHLLWVGLTAGGALLVVAVFGKLLGTILPARIHSSWRDSVIFGVSMVPRAEIALLIVATAGAIGEHRLPDAVFPGMIMVSLVTCVGVPLVLERLLKTE
jgi:Kef-type K+ transport system membrane component KefB